MSPKLEVGARCPNCGQPELDADETSCIILLDMSYREYKCHHCNAIVNVQVPIAWRNPRDVQP